MNSKLGKMISSLVLGATILGTSVSAKESKKTAKSPSSTSQGKTTGGRSKGENLECFSKKLPNQETSWKDKTKMDLTKKHFNLKVNADKKAAIGILIKAGMSNEAARRLVDDLGPVFKKCYRQDPKEQCLWQDEILFNEVVGMFSSYASLIKKLDNSLDKQQSFMTKLNGTENLHIETGKIKDRLSFLRGLSDAHPNADDVEKRFEKVLLREIKKIKQNSEVVEDSERDMGPGTALELNLID